MNLLFTLNAGYIPQLTVLLHSLMLSNPGEAFTIYVAHSSLGEGDFEKIAAVVDPACCTVVPVLVPDSMLENAPRPGRITKEAYYRLLAMDYLPDDVERVLYLDPDIVVINPLRPIYAIEFMDNLFVAVTHIFGLWERFNLRRLDMPLSAKYINSGVMLMNIKGLRASGVTAEKVLRFISDNEKKIVLADQDTVNMMFYRRTLAVDPRIFNLDEKILHHYRREIDLAWVEANTVIVHFNGKSKPWKPRYRGRMGYLFERYNDGLCPMPERRPLLEKR